MKKSDFFFPDTSLLMEVVGYPWVQFQLPRGVPQRGLSQSTLQLLPARHQGCLLPQGVLSKNRSHLRKMTTSLEEQSVSL